MKYIQELNLDFDKTICKKFIQESSIDFEKIKQKNKWHNNVLVTQELTDHIGPITQHLKDCVLILTLFPINGINIHADGAATRLDNTYNVSINIPVENCTEDTKTYFWDFDDERSIEYIHLEDLGTRDIVDKSQLKKKYEYIFKDTAVLFRNEYPHSVENKCKDLRLMLSWRFKPEYSWEESIEICKQYNLL